MNDLTPSEKRTLARLKNYRGARTGAVFLAVVTGIGGVIDSVENSMEGSGTATFIAVCCFWIAVAYAADSRYQYARTLSRMFDGRGKNA